MSWFVYILKCGDETLYTGITNDFESRLEAHKSGQGAKYTKGRGPFKAMAVWSCQSRSEASKMECYIKKLSRQEKLEYIAQKT